MLAMSGTLKEAIERNNPFRYSSPIYSLTSNCCSSLVQDSYYCCHDVSIVLRGLEGCGLHTIESLLQKQTIQTTHNEAEEDAEADDGCQFFVHDFKDQAFHFHYIHAVDAVFNDALDVE